MKNEALNKFKNLISYITLVLIIVLPWFLKSGYLFFTDTAWGPNIIIPEFTSSGHFYLHFLIKILSFILPSDLVEKFFITIVFGIVLFGGYKIIQNFTHSKIILFLGSAFTLFNPFVYDRVMYGQFGIVLSFGFFLTMFGYLISFYLEPLDKKKLFLGSVFAGLSILFAPHFIFFIGLIYFIFGVLIFLKSLADKRDLLRLAWLFFLSVFIILVINFNWLYGAFWGKTQTIELIEANITEQDLISFQTAGNTSQEVINNILMMSGFWGKDQFRYLDLANFSENWGRSFFILLPLIIWGLITGWRKKEYRNLSVGLIFIFLISMILAAGIKVSLFKNFNLWLFNNFPFYKGLREPQKWVALIVIVYSVFLSLGIKEFFKTKIVKHNKFIISLFLSAIIIMQAPLLLFGFWGQIKPVEYPKDWYIINEYIIQQDDCQSNILFLPWHMYMSFNWIGKIVANPAKTFFTCPVIQGTNMEWGGIYDNSSKKEGKLIGEWVENRGQTDLLINNHFNIKYIILAKELDWQNYLWVEKLDNLKLIKESETLRVYERRE